MLVVYLYIAARSQEVTSSRLFIIDNNRNHDPIKLYLVYFTTNRLAILKNRILCSSLTWNKNQTATLTHYARTRGSARVIWCHESHHDLLRPWTRKICAPASNQCLYAKQLLHSKCSRQKDSPVRFGTFTYWRKLCSQIQPRDGQRFMLKDSFLLKDS